MNTALVLASATEESTLVGSLLAFLPLLVFFAFLYLFVRKYNIKNKGYMERAMKHMNEIEKKTDRMIELLEKLQKK
jgi:hypothetical protein